MNFTDNPKLFIIEYYDDKRNQIDINCEKLILKVEDDAEHEILNKQRIDLIEKIESVKQLVLKRYDTLNSKYTKEMLANKTQEIKDEIFFDRYCLVMDFYDELIPLQEIRVGVLLFSEFDDHLLRYFK